jgi:hypothetical protein
MRYASDHHLLWILADAIIKAPASFSDEYKSLLPAKTVETIEARRRYFAEREEEERREREAGRLQQIEESERITLERIAEVEAMPFEGLLDSLFGGRSAEALEAFVREQWQASLTGFLSELVDADDPARPRAYARLVEAGRSIGLKIPTSEEIEAARLQKLQEAEEAEQKRIEAYIKSLEEATWETLCRKAIESNLVPGEWIAILPRVRDAERITRFRQHFIEIAPRQDDPINRRTCELMIRHLATRNNPGTGAAFSLR